MSLAALKTWMVGGERGGSLQPAGIVRVSSLVADWNQASKHLAQHQPHAWKRLLNGLLVRLEEFAKSAPEWDSQLKAFKAVGKQLGQTESFGTTPKSQCQRIALMLCHDARMPVFEEGFEDDLAVLRPLIGKNWSLVTPQNASPLASGSAQRRESVPELTPSSEEETALREGGRTGEREETD